MRPASIKTKAIQLRKRGFSYSMISKELLVAKSTLSEWLNEIPYTPNRSVLQRIQFGPARTGELSRQRKMNMIREAKQLAKNELGKITERDLWLLGLGIYIGEGAKAHGTIRISNSDPMIIVCAMQWLQKICKLPLENIHISLNVYPDTNIEKTIHFWSKLTGIPRRNFKKTQIDKRQNKLIQKHGILPYGTAHLRVLSRGNKEFGVFLHRKIIGWIEAALHQA